MNEGFEPTRAAHAPAKRCGTCSAAGDASALSDYQLCDYVFEVIEYVGSVIT